MKRTLTTLAVIGAVIVATPIPGGYLALYGAWWLWQRAHERNRVFIYPRSRVYQTRNVTLEVVR